MGLVYRARDLRLGRMVALKSLSAEHGLEPARRDRFVSEARTVSALNHSNIVTIYEIATFEGLDFIAMELVDGEPSAAASGPPA